MNKEKHRFRGSIHLEERSNGPRKLVIQTTAQQLYNGFAKKNIMII